MTALRLVEPTRKGAVPPIPARQRPAHRIASDAEAIRVAHELAAIFAPGAAERDRERRLPLAEIERFSQSGLWAITVPTDYGGAGVSTATLAEVTAIIAAADASLGQIPQNHFYMVEAVRLGGTDAQQRHWFAKVLDGDRLGNAFTEIGTKTAVDFKTRVRKVGERWVLDGRKFYSTGALYAHWILAVAKDERDRATIVFVERGTPGLTLIDDWSSFGQRTTGSGTTLFEGIEVPDLHVVPHQDVFDRPTPMGPVAQIIHAAVDLGIARAAFADTVAFVRNHARPWMDSGQDHGWEDPYSIQAIGELKVRLSGAEALVSRAAEATDLATVEPTERRVAQASVAVAEAKVATTEASLHIASKLFELAGSRSTLEEFNFDRHWRNARTHTLHDPVRWKYRHIGNYRLNDVLPPRHGAL